MSDEERWCVAACKSHAPKLTESCVCVRDAQGRPVTGLDNLRRMAAAPELEAENARLRARVAELETEFSEEKCDHQDTREMYSLKVRRIRELIELLKGKADNQRGLQAQAESPYYSHEHYGMALAFDKTAEMVTALLEKPQ